MTISIDNNNDEKVRIFCKFIVKNGKRIYPKTGKVFSFLVEPKKSA